MSIQLTLSFPRLPSRNARPQSPNLFYFLSNHPLATQSLHQSSQFFSHSQFNFHLFQEPTTHSHVLLSTTHLSFSFKIKVDLIHEPKL